MGGILVVALAAIAGYRPGAADSTAADDSTASPPPSGWWKAGAAACPPGGHIDGGPPPGSTRAICARQDGTRHGPAAAMAFVNEVELNWKAHLQQEPDPPTGTGSRPLQPPSRDHR